MIFVDPPFVHTLSPKNIIEGGNISITCFADPGNPEPKTFFWTRVNIGSFRQNGTTLNLPNIQRNSSGNYKCTAVNMYNNGKKGSHSQIMVINVLCKLSPYSYQQIFILAYRYYLSISQLPFLDLLKIFCWPACKSGG